MDTKKQPLFAVIRKNGDVIPIEFWVMELWVADQLRDSYLLQVIGTAKSILGPWRELRENQISKSKT